MTVWYENESNLFYSFSYHDMLATDWLIEEDPKPKRRLYWNHNGDFRASSMELQKPWTPLSRKEFDSLFEGE